MKKIVFIIIALMVGYGYVQEKGISIPDLYTSGTSSDSTIQNAYNNRQSDLQVQGVGTVIRILPDDLKGSRHQKFILRLGTRQTLLISHNIDLAPRISGLTAGDTVEFYGEYEWNSKGGVIHWTHHDPKNNHVGGWLKHDGRIYQ